MSQLGSMTRQFTGFDFDFARGGSVFFPLRPRFAFVDFIILCVNKARIVGI